jgi:hypothetical protein
MPSIKKKPPTPSNLVWKIRRKADGLFSNGSGSYPGFSKEGKCFYSEHKLLIHLNMVNRYYQKYKNNRWQGARHWSHPYLNCEIVQLKLVEEIAVPLEGYGE